jgi:polyphosphate glucokinase
MEILGIDVGGSALKGAIVDVNSGKMIAERVRVATPEGAKPADMAEVVLQIVKQLNWKGPIGCGFPAVVKNGVAYSAANIDQSWIGTNVSKIFSETAHCPVYTANDADVAGLAELEFGAGKEYINEIVLILTLGTGIGTALFANGHLMPNMELGHIEIRGKDAEKRASAAQKTNKKLSYRRWAERLQEYLERIEALINPDVIILGGGISKDSDRFLQYLNTRAKLLPATLLNQAGIVGAAMYAKQQLTTIENTSKG